MIKFRAVNALGRIENKPDEVTVRLLGMLEESDPSHSAHYTRESDLIKEVGDALAWKMNPTIDNMEKLTSLLTHPNPIVREVTSKVLNSL
ncbi:hypothetical protein HYT58_01265 [Candidatus Woesearchaeota archaeon]|nr:hypothetical protein [Candidatus Woesearchaeota archaeon]